MSFVEHRERIEKGDTVILFLNVNSIYAIEVTEKIPNRHGNLVENKFQTIYGVFTVMDLVGQRYGSKLVLPKGWGYLLHPSCELWTKTVNHRTQIIYTPDISLIVFGLDLAPGSLVIEAGTGTGSLSHALIRTIYPLGHLYTYDFHEKRSELARDEFEKHGLRDWVTVGHRDVISEGFNVDKLVDAIFLDLPSPWEVVPHVRRALKRGGKLCTFSPCIEQVQKTVEALKATNAFIMIRTQEVLQRPLSIQTRIIVSLDLTPPPGPDSMDGTEEESKKMAPVKKDQVKYRSIVPPATTPGHTGYMTFATMICSPIGQESRDGDSLPIDFEGMHQLKEETLMEVSHVNEENIEMPRLVEEDHSKEVVC